MGGDKHSNIIYSSLSIGDEESFYLPAHCGAWSYHILILFLTYHNLLLFLTYQSHKHRIREK